MGRNCRRWDGNLLTLTVPSRSKQLAFYPTDGTTDDFAYGELGLAAYTFELGTSFFQSCSYFENNLVTWNIPALVYAAKAAQAPTGHRLARML